MLPELIVLVAAVVGSSSMVGILCWFWYRIQRLDTARRLARARLQEAIAELEESRDRLRGLESRVDFLQELLEGRGPDGPGPGLPPGSGADHRDV